MTEKLSTNWGGRRDGSGRKTKTDSEKAKNRTIRLYDWEVEPVREFIKNLRKKV